MNYTINQLRIYLKITQTQSVTKAAEELHLTQPAVSIQLKNFQSQFQIPLTELIGRKIYITDFGKEIIPVAIQNNRKVVSYQYEGYWTDIGNIHSFFEANIGLTDDIPLFNLFDKHPIFSRARMLPPSKISGTTLEKTVISDGCIINASRIERSVIGIRTRIGTGTTIVNTFLDFVNIVGMFHQKLQNMLWLSKPL